MELRQKFKIIVWAFIFLLLLNAVTIFMIFNKKNSTSNFNHPIDTSSNFNPPNNNHPPQGGMFADVLITELELSQDQIQDFNFILQNFKQNSHSNFDSLKYYSDLIEYQLENHSIDTFLLQEYANKIGYFQASLKMNFIYYYLDIKNILTDSQKLKLFEVFMEFKKNQRFHNNPQNNHPGNRHGRNNGQRNGPPHNGRPSGNFN